MVIGLGVDIIEVARFARQAGGTATRVNERLLERLFTPAERRYCEAKARPETHYAARFAAKEALLKALGTGLVGRFRWHDMEVGHDPAGRPEFHLSGGVADHLAGLGPTRVWLSLSHTRGQAVAVAVLDRLDSPPGQ